MTSQFFKDAHGANNRFVPRSFSLNLGATLSNQPIKSATTAVNAAGSSLINVSSGDESSESRSHPQATSTAPSTATSSSAFFSLMDGKAMNGIHQHANTDNSKDISIIEDSSELENVFKVNARSSEAGRPVQHDSQDDDIEIIEPDISRVEDGSEHQATETSMTDYSGDQTSGDLLMDALFKSQKLCNGLRGRLGEATSKIQSQTDQLNSQKKAIQRMKSTFKVFKDNMAAMESKLVSLKEARVADNNAILTFKNEYSQALKNIEDFKQDVSNFKKKIDHLKQVKLNSSYEVDKSMVNTNKNNEIQSLQGNLDEAAGLLSEQKIKTLDLEKNLENCRQIYDSKIQELHLKNEAFQEALFSKLSGTESSIISNFDQTFTNKLGPLISGIPSEVNTKMSTLTKQFLDSLKVSDESRIKQLNETCSIVVNAIGAEVSKVHELVDTKIDAVSTNQTNVEKSMGSMTDSLKALKKELQVSHQLDKKESQKVFKSLEGSISKLDKDIKDQNLTKEELNGLKGEYSILQKLSEDLKQKIESFQVENKAVNEELSSVKSKLGELEVSKRNAEIDLTRVQSQFSNKEIELKNCEMKAEKSSCAYDNKARAQQELFKLVSEERDKVRKELDELKVKFAGLDSELSRFKAMEPEKERKEKQIEKIQFEKEKLIASLMKEKEELKKELDKLRTNMQDSKTLTGDLEITMESPTAKEADDFFSRITSQKSNKRIQLQAPMHARPETVAVPPSMTKLPTRKEISKGLTKSNLPKRKMVHTDESKMATKTLPAIDEFAFDESFENDEPLFKPKRYTKRKITRA